MAEPFKQRSILEVMREKNAARGGGKAEATPPASPPAKPKKEKAKKPPAEKAPPKKPGEKPPFTGFEKITAACGHEIDFGVWPDKQDPYRDKRRENKKARRCPACIQEDEKARREVAKAKKREKARAQGTSHTLKWNGRLPHGSAFSVAYDARAVLWTGTLTVPMLEGEPAVFTMSFENLFPLLARLDKQYRKTLPGWVEGGPYPEAPSNLPEDAPGKLPGASSTEPGGVQAGENPPEEVPAP